jgi:hypothetical protein
LKLKELSPELTASLGLVVDEFMIGHVSLLENLMNKPWKLVVLTDLPHVGYSSYATLVFRNA